MAAALELPTQLRINAYDGATSPVGDLPGQSVFGLGKRTSRRALLAPAEPADPRNWRDPRVGWGLVVPDRDDMDAAAKAVGHDLPPSLKALIADRNQAPVLRWRPELKTSFLRRHHKDGTMQDLSVQAPDRGVGKGQLPQYLLIWGSPVEIPWAVQYNLNMSAFVGRLDLQGDALERYVEALLAGFTDAPPNPRTPVLWSVDHGAPDITWLMTNGLGAKLKDDIQADLDLKDGLVWLGSGQSGGAALADALGLHRPALVVTTSHGMTGPLADPSALQASLGLPVDQAYQVVSPQTLAGWDPYGAIWYAHACCSAGSESESRYEALLSDVDPVGRMLRGVAAAAGAVTAPLPTALLGGVRPLGAFVGHVEPTFDWTLRDPRNGQLVTKTLRQSLYDQLYRKGSPTPIGLALAGVFREAGAFHAAWADAIEDINAGVADARNWALYNQLVAMDRQSLVILGDPTVALPRL